MKVLGRKKEMISAMLIAALIISVGILLWPENEVLVTNVMEATPTKLVLAAPNSDSEEITKGQEINFIFTDDNTNENLIIRSDKKTYFGFNSATVYFNIHNESKEDLALDSTIHFKNGEKVSRVMVLNNNGEWEVLDFMMQESAWAKEVQRKDINNFKNQSTFRTELAGDSVTYFKVDISYTPRSEGKFFIEAFGQAENQNRQLYYGHLDPWYDSNWNYRQKITIQSDQVATTTDNFPMLATTTQTVLKYTGNGGKVGSSTGADILFTDSDGETIIDYEREYYSSSTGELVVWIEVDISSTTDKDIYMYYGNASVSADQATTTGVWDSNYKAVWHLPYNNLASTTNSINSVNGTAEANTSFSGHSKIPTLIISAAISMADIISFFLPNTFIN